MSVKPFNPLLCLYEGIQLYSVIEGKLFYS